MEDFSKNYRDTLNTDIRFIKGVGEKRADAFNKMSVYNLWDLIYFFPRTYEDRREIKRISDLNSGDVCCIKAICVSGISQKRIKKNISLCGFQASDRTGVIFVKWFTNPNVKLSLKKGDEFIIYGRCINGYSGMEFEMTVMERSESPASTLQIVPVYPLSKGLTQNVVRNAIANAFVKVEKLVDVFDKSILERYSLMDINSAVGAMHSPENFETLKMARRRLSFEELFMLQLSLFLMRNNRDKDRNHPITDTFVVDEFIDSLPFELTKGQKNALDSILEDLSSDVSMNRLLQGDVGCGKTVVAAACMYVVAKNGYQCAMMAPTEILANQHYETLKKFFGDRIRIALLTGSTKKKKALYEKIEQGEYDVIIGTHAVIQKSVKFKNLLLAITDEQHRFGVNQRARLFEKSGNNFANVLVMSATPIPRTLALILYGDLDISVIDTKPAGRQEIETIFVNSSYKKRAYEFVRKELSRGRQGYVVCPLVSDSDSLSASSSEGMYETLSKKVFPEYKLGLIHGKMSNEEKDAVMEDFRKGEINLLVSTTVIEVGVDVPNSTIMVIENAERFGLSQLHQLRGRVGRGSEKSYCILISDSETKENAERMTIMTKSNDGMEIASKDLELRGSGEFFGTRQHGLPELKIANLFTDTDLLEDCRKLCEEIIKNDPHLQSEENRLIRQRIMSIYEKTNKKKILN